MLAVLFLSLSVGQGLTTQEVPGDGGGAVSGIIRFTTMNFASDNYVPQRIWTVPIIIKRSQGDKVCMLP